MRALACALSLLAPCAASAQGEDEFAEAAAIDDAAYSIWMLDDGIGVEEAPWNTYDPDASYLPRGVVHMGVALRVAWLPGAVPMVPEGPLFDIAGFVDVRYTHRSPMRFRVALAFAAQPYRDESVGAGTWRTTSPWSGRVRLFPFSIDIHHYFTFRIAGDVGFQWYPKPNDDGGGVAFMTGATAETVVRLLDGTLEVGAYGGFQTTANFAAGRMYESQGLTVHGVLGITAGYVAP